MKLPAPTPDQRAHSYKLAQVIVNEIKQHGPIDFARYMQMALYEPGLGYYRAGNMKFGEAGDFITAPLISPLFSRCLARQCQQVINEVEGAVILELGAGTGAMALEILRELDRQNAMPSQYYILELSAELIQRQQALFEEKAPQYLEKVQWLQALPQTPIKGIILANEVCDAMPVHRFTVTDSIEELYVAYENEHFTWVNAKASREVLQALHGLEIKFPAGYTSEINLLINPWVKSLAHSLAQGVILLIDYGYAQAEYYHSQRTMGTLLCHFRQHAHDDPLIYPGIQDITAFVDFTAIAQAAAEAALEVVGFTHQAAFLLNCGLMECVDSGLDVAAQYAQAQQIKRLTLPGEMGERFKAIALARDLPIPLLGFSQVNLLNRL